MHVRPLPPGPLAFIGDVHGEYEALQQLERHLDGRHQVFLGDLIDRGPDSPGVVQHVRAQVQAGLASAILGNHELNLVRGLSKSDNRWFRGEEQTYDGQRMPQAFATPEERASIIDFLGELPLALEREDVRAVHASWGPTEEVRASTDSVPLLFDVFERQVMEGLRADGLMDDPTWRKRWRALMRRAPKPTLDPEMQEKEYRIQNGNPVKWLTTGPEGKREELEWISGRWRQLERLPWWRVYRQPPAVVIGHYWRLMPPGSSLDVVRSGKFAGATPQGALGPLKNVFCIDYSVGKRFLDRLRGRPYTGRLAALLWPEKVLVFDDGQVVPTD